MTPAARAEIEQVVDALLDIAQSRTCTDCGCELPKNVRSICEMCFWLEQVMGPMEVV